MYNCVLFFCIRAFAGPFNVEVVVDVDVPKIIQLYTDTVLKT